MMKDLHTNWIMLLLVAILGAALLLSIASGLLRMGGSHTITVTATGTVSGIPSAATLYLYANGTGASAINATTNLSTTLASLNSTLATYVNGNFSNVTTSSYSLRQANFTKNGTRMPYIAYIATEWIYIAVNATNAGPLLGAISKTPNVYVSSTSTALSKTQYKSMMSASISAAMANATSQARAVVGAGVVLTTTNVTVSNYRVYYPMYASSSAKIVPGVANPTFYPGTAGVTSTVFVIFTYSK